MTTRICTMCRQEKPIENFYWTTTGRNGKKVRHSRCKDCRRKQFSEWAKTDQGKRNKRLGVLRREFGLTEVDYQQMWNKQAGLCAICRRPETKRHKDGTLYQLSVDHDHRTGRVRALLCQKCNVGLGSFEDNTSVLRAAANYLERHWEGQTGKVASG